MTAIDFHPAASELEVAENLLVLYMAMATANDYDVTSTITHDSGDTALSHVKLALLRVLSAIMYDGYEVTELPLNALAVREVYDGCIESLITVSASIEHWLRQQAAS